MDWQSVLYRWGLFSEKLYPIRDEVADIFKTKCFYDEHWQYQERSYIPDEDTVFLLKFSTMLNEICYFLKSHISVLERRVDIEEEIRSNQEQAFEAWKRGLCPVLMRSVQRYVKPPDYNVWGTYDEIAEFMTNKNTSYDDTLKAINAWKLSGSEQKVA